MKTIQEITELKKTIQEAGHNRGYSIASYCEIELTEETEEKFKEECYETETNNRDYTPFEFTARELNDLDCEFDLMAEKINNADNMLEHLFEPWEEFDNGITKGINQYVEEFIKRVENNPIKR